MKTAIEAKKDPSKAALLATTAEQQSTAHSSLTKDGPGQIGFNVPDGAPFYPWHQEDDLMDMMRLNHEPAFNGPTFDTAWNPETMDFPSSAINEIFADLHEDSDDHYEGRLNMN